MDLKDFGARVRLQRLQKGWTQEHLARELNISTAFVGHIERGTRTASIDTLIALAMCLDVSTDYLLAGSMKRDPLLPKPLPDDGNTDSNRFNDMITELQNVLQRWSSDK